MLVFVMYYIYATSGLSLLIESTDSMIDLVHGFVNMHAAQPSVWHFSALVRLMRHGIIYHNIYFLCSLMRFSAVDIHMSDFFVTLQRYC